MAQDGASPKFAFPLKCTLGKNCWALNYTDTTPDGDGQMVDPGCLNRTYDGHAGTDFTIQDERAMKKGIPVVAARSGRVVETRNDMPDQWLNTAQLAAIKNTPDACGNFAAIGHGNGWVTKYCHMKRGSVEVRPGQTVRAGEKLGEVGLSGNTSFPHLHFEILRDGRAFDPFTGASILHPCGQSAASLWEPSARLFYEPLTIVQSGFETKKPSVGLLDRGMKMGENLYAKDAPNLYYYVLFNGARQGDEVVLTVTDPDGKEFFTRRMVQDRASGRQFYYAARQTDKILLRKGIYKGNAVITRVYQDGTKQQWAKANSIDVR